MFVQLAPGWPGSEFRRSVIVAGKSKNSPPIRLRTLTFSRGAVVEVTGEDLKAIERDLGHALVEATTDGKGRPRPPGFVSQTVPSETTTAAAEDKPGGKKAGGPKPAAASPGGGDAKT